MNLISSNRLQGCLGALTLALTLGASPSTTFAGPGAHGPNGEHLDAPAAHVGSAADTPRMTAQSDVFELVAQLNDGEMSILIDHYATNAPVLNASVEVESGAFKAQATFHKDHGDYAVDDAAMLKHLATPGEHAVVITVMAGDDSDLLEGVLHVGEGSATAGDHGASHGPHGWPWWTWAGGAGLALMLAIAWRWRRRHSPRHTPTHHGDPA